MSTFPSPVTGTMVVSEIPLAQNGQAARPQTFQASLNGVIYLMTLNWNNASQCWTLDLSSSSGALLLGSIPLITGTDLIDQFSYLGIGGSLIVQTDNSPDAVPTFTNLGVNGHLYFITPPQFL